jgi:isopentenyldiphosphate isomerase
VARKPLQHRPLTVKSVGSELVDAYDADGRLIGVKERAAVHRDGTWHRCFHCLILSGGDASPRVVLQRRARVVVDYPGLLDVTVAGHLLAGETVLEAAAREISEELGVELPTQSLEPFGEYRLIVETPGIWAREITDVFITHDERSPDAYRCNPVEVASVLTLPLTDAVKLWSGERSYATVREFEGGRSVLRDVALRDFVNEVPEYWPWLAAALDLATAR